ncbi:PepSY domain-containing protein [Streptomyces sp. NPDC058274]|uniref:PepSY domain-containing protein n=1 Tax=Streptomyces sp. NPDC058274 TaxID=3346416 RepID=UPI0036E2F26F
MKRNIVIAGVTAAALVGGSAATALATTVDGGTPTRQSSGPANGAAQSISVRDDDGARDDDGTRDDDAAQVKSAKVSAADAITAALNSTPGTAVSADLDDDDKGAVAWEVDVLGKGDTWHSVRVDPGTGKVLGSHTEHEDDTAEVRAALKGTSTSAAQAARAAAAKGTVTSIDLDEDGGTHAWEAETRSSDGTEHEWRVGLDKTDVTADRTSDDTGSDDSGSDATGSDHSDDD